MSHVFLRLLLRSFGVPYLARCTPPYTPPQSGVNADAADSDRFSRPKPQTIGVFANVENDIANEQPEQAGFRCNTTETTT
jgi:hypothetical protein